MVLAVLLLAPAPSAGAQVKDLVNENPYYRDAGDKIAKDNGYLNRESRYFGNKSGYFPGKSRYFKDKSPYVRNNEPNAFEKFANSVKSLFS